MPAAWSEVKEGNLRRIRSRTPSFVRRLFVSIPNISQIDSTCCFDILLKTSIFSFENCFRATASCISLVNVLASMSTLARFIAGRHKFSSFRFFSEDECEILRSHFSSSSGGSHYVTPLNPLSGGNLPDSYELYCCIPLPL